METPKSNPKTILIADEEQEIKNKLEKYFKNDPAFKVVACTKNGNETIEKIKELCPDVVLLDIVLSGIDGFDVMKQAFESNINSKFFVLSSLSSNAFIQKAMQMGAEYYMLKPTEAGLVASRILDIFSQPKIVRRPDEYRGLDEKITNIFITVGIPAHIKGYYFLREAVKMAVNNPGVINSITKILYPSIAKQFETSASKVERAIRHAIEVAWNRGKIDKINNIFGIDIYVNNEKPTNGEFIALVADKMLLEG